MLKPNAGGRSSNILGNFLQAAVPNFSVASHRDHQQQHPFETLQRHAKLVFLVHASIDVSFSMMPPWLVLAPWNKILGMGGR